MMDNTLFSQAFGKWVQTSNIAENIPSELSVVIETAQDPSLDGGARKACRDYAVIKHKKELFDIISAFKQEGEKIVYSTYMRNHFRHGNGEDLFVNITQNEGAKILGSFNYARGLFLEAGFSKEDIDKVLTPRQEFDPKIIYEIGILICERDGMPQLYLCPYKESNSTIKLTPTIIYPTGLTLEKGITIVKKAYEYMNKDDADIFDAKMIIKEPKTKDRK